VTIASAVANGAPTVKAEAPPNEQGSIEIAVPPAAQPAMPLDAGSGVRTVADAAGMAPTANNAKVPPTPKARIHISALPISASLVH
jgi:hypothetical protein